MMPSIATGVLPSPAMATITVTTPARSRGAQCVITGQFAHTVALQLMSAAAKARIWRFWWRAATMRWAWISPSTVSPKRNDCWRRAGCKLRPKSPICEIINSRGSSI